MLIRPVSSLGVRVYMTGFLSHSKKLDKHNSLYHNIIDTQTIAQNNFRNVFDSVLEGYQ